MHWLRTRFLAGLAVTVPLIVTVMVLRLLYVNLNGLLAPWLAHALGREIPGLGLAATLVLVLLVGLLAANLAGRRMISLFEGALERLPLVRAVYRTSRQIVAAVAAPSGEGRRLREPVMIEYPRPGLYAYGFVTAYVRLERGGVPQEMANVYLPSPPVPTTGVLVAVPVTGLVRLDLSAEETMKLIVSGGLVAPPVLTDGGGAPRA